MKVIILAGGLGTRLAEETDVKEADVKEDNIKEADVKEDNVKEADAEETGKECHNVSNDE